MHFAAFQASNLWEAGSSHRNSFLFLSGSRSPLRAQRLSEMLLRWPEGERRALAEEVEAYCRRRDKERQAGDSYHVRKELY